MISCYSSGDSTWEMGRRLPGVKCDAAKDWIVPGRLAKIVRAPRKRVSAVGRLCTVVGLPPLGGAHTTGVCPNPRFCLGLRLWIYGVWTTFALQKLCLEVPGDLQLWSSPRALEPSQAAMDIVAVPSPGAGAMGILLPSKHAHPTHLSWLSSRSLQHGEPRPPVPCPQTQPRGTLLPPDSP